MDDGWNKEYEVRLCKKCGIEIPSTDKSKLCINCRRKRGERIKVAIFTALGVGAGAVYFGKGLIKNTNDELNDSDVEDNYD